MNPKISTAQPDGKIRRRSDTIVSLFGTRNAKYEIIMAARTNPPPLPSPYGCRSVPSNVAKRDLLLYHCHILAVKVHLINDVNIFAHLLLA